MFDVRNNDYMVARYDANGILDNSFGKDGITVTPIGVSERDCLFGSDPKRWQNCTYWKFYER